MDARSFNPIRRRIEMDGQEIQNYEEKDALHRSSPKAKIIYEAIRREGEEELARASFSLGWSGLAAGLSMGFSFFMEALLHSYLPPVSWAELITKFGYSIGFLIVILGRQQLFTENTLTPVLHFLQCKTWNNFCQVARLWGIVLLCNIIGAIIFAALLHYLQPFDDEVRQALVETSKKVYHMGFTKTAIGAVFAGWLIALMVWLLPFAESARVGVIIIITYVVGLGGFAHIIAGTVAAAFAVMCGNADLGAFFFHFFFPALTGNIFGGVAFVAAINHAQVNPERESCDID
jgi:formate/nitrite transporter FocA (FNT family)